MADAQPAVEPVFGPDGLVPVIAQDVSTGAVLTLAYMNRDTWQETLRTGMATFWSRSRQTRWRKGETSGNTMRVHGIQLDCDHDAVLLEVEPAGPACHTGAVSCFFEEVQSSRQAAAEETR